MRRLLALTQGLNIRLGGSAVFDQAVVGGTNFLTAILVGRLCGPSELGLFALVTTIWYLVLAFLESGITTPFTVFVHRLDEHKRTTYAGSAIAHVAGLSTVAVVGLGLMTALLYAMGFQELALVFAAMTATIPVRLLRQFARRFHYATLNLSRALVLDISIAGLQLGALASLYFLDLLSAATSFLAVGGAYAVVLAVWLACHKRSFRIRRQWVLPDLFKNWALGRWLVASQIAMIASGYSLPWIIALLLDQSQTGIYFGCATLVRIGAPLLVAIQNVLSPRSATAFAESGLPGLRRVVRRATVGLLLGMGLFTALIAFGGDWLVGIFFGAEYGGQWGVVALLASNELAFALMLGAASGLTVLERTEFLFRSHLMGILVTVTMAFTLVGPLGLPGAAVAQLAGTLVASTITIICYRRVVRKLEAELPETKAELSGPETPTAIV
ncbi:MAG: lipopolysaccharide biosynthesis protein [Planctomycetes bacterium]|nr:lipopolysaccharide biosynthesis protein [Planctomycetota bacterium]